VEDDLRKEYSSAVFYAEDAFAGLHVMSDLTDEDASVRDKRLSEGATRREVQPAGRGGAAGCAGAREHGTIEHCEGCGGDSVPPFFRRAHSGATSTSTSCTGTINETALFKNQWQLKTASATDYLRW